MRATVLDGVTCHKLRGTWKGLRHELELCFLFTDDDTAGTNRACPRLQSWFESHGLLAFSPFCSQI